VKPEEQELSLLALERDDPRLEEVARDVVVETPLRGAHRVLEQACLSPDEWLLQELLRLPPERALDDDAEARAELVFLARSEMPVTLFAEHLAEGRQIAKERARRIDVLHEPPQLGQIVLDGRRREKQDRHLAHREQTPHAARRARGGRLVVVVAELVEALVDAGEHLVRFVDDAKIEGPRRREGGMPVLAARGLATNQKDAVAVEPAGARGALDSLQSEEREEFRTPLPEQRLRCDEEHAARAFREDLSNHEARFDGLPQSYLVGEDATAFA
jgi:hypothetical protein